MRFFTAPKATRRQIKGCKRYDIDVMIDDRPNVALFLAEAGIKVLLFDAGYNQEVEHENILRITNWIDIYQEISKLTC